MFSTSFQEINRLGPAFINLRWFRLAHICFQWSPQMRRTRIKQQNLLNKSTNNLRPP